MPKPAVLSKNSFNLEAWYASDAAKRSFGRICQAVNEEGAEICLLGTPEQPLLVLKDADLVSKNPDEILITIDEARADWPAVTTAASIYGTSFRILGKKHERAVLARHPKSKHPAERYRRSSSAEINRLAQQIENLANEVRKLAVQAASKAIPSFDNIESIAERLSLAADIIDRRFREVWRSSNNLSIIPSSITDSVLI